MSKLLMALKRVRNLQYKHPHRTSDIKGFWELCLNEIEQGESIDNEINHLESSLDDLEEEESNG